MKLIVANIDGTIVNSPDQKIPSQALVDVIQSVKDEYYITCATGRSRSWAKPVLEAAHFTAPCILGGGTYIVDPETLDVVWKLPLPADQLQNIKNILRKQSDLKVLFNDYSEEEYMAGGWELDRLLNADEVFLMEIVAVSDDEAAKLVEAFQALPSVTAVKMHSFHPGGVVDIHVLNEGSTKEHAILRLQEMLNISKEDTIGIGDGHNDFHIFNAVDTKVAVANAVPELKDLADVVIGDVKDDAVVTYIQELAKR